MSRKSFNVFFGTLSVIAALGSLWIAADPSRENAKHTHDLARNIWIALVAILGLAFGLGFSPTG